MGLKDGRAAPCPDTPNCVSSEEEGKPSYMPPLTFSVAPEAAWAAARKALAETDGTIRKEEGDYLSATYTSFLFRFVDDVELRMDRAKRVIHIRSASRLGKWDFGVNRRRVEKIRAAFERYLAKETPGSR